MLYYITLSSIKSKSSNKRDWAVCCFRTPCLAVAIATRNQSQNSLVSAADDRAAPERNRRDSQPARSVRNAPSASPDRVRDPSISIIIQSPGRGPTRPTATPLPRTDPSAKDRISRYVDSSGTDGSSRSRVCFNSSTFRDVDRIEHPANFARDPLFANWKGSLLLSKSAVVTA